MLSAKVSDLLRLIFHPAMHRAISVAILLKRRDEKDLGLRSGGRGKLLRLKYFRHVHLINQTTWLRVLSAAGLAQYAI